MGRLFGTDGVRGLANCEIKPELAMTLGQAAARVLAAQVPQGRRVRALIGRDTRVSGEMLDAALAAGMASAGVDVVQVGVIPTPGVAYLAARRDDIDFAAMISASHNPMQDNGIKFFAHGGYKLPDAVEDAIEDAMDHSWPRPTGDAVGDVFSDDGGMKRQYLDHLVAVAGSLEGLRVVVDCANGAASEIAPAALRAAGAEVIVLHAEPNGRNINDGCGSTHPESLCQAVAQHGADAGFAFDGDADRCLAVDQNGALVDGDQIMGILALHMKEQGKLNNDTLVATVMSNLGLKLAMEEAGIAMVQTAVGDRYVLEAMRAGGHALGGEQSGHIIDLEYATTGDGTLTAILLTSRLKASGQRASELASIVKRLPQVLINVPGVDKARAATDEGVATAVAQAEGQLGSTGRVLLRPSGTEPLVRVMVEAPTQSEAEEQAQKLADVVRERLAM